MHTHVSTLAVGHLQGARKASTCIVEILHI